MIMLYLSSRSKNYNYFSC